LFICIAEEERTVIVTGTARGIDYAITEAFFKNGDFVALGDLNQEQADTNNQGIDILKHKIKLQLAYP
jgi:NAD(P)-dependent dehydrogenase (short-subunit alcohol dehydrogenase family)